MQKNRTDFITSFRGFSAFYVMISHIWFEVWPAYQAPYGYDIYPSGLMAPLTGWLFYSHFGVVAFIFISGFCLIKRPIQNGGMEGDLKGYALRRIRRIIPAYYTGLFFSTILAVFVINQITYTQWDSSLPVTKNDIISHIILLQAFYDPVKINYTYWSVSAEAVLYFFFPIFVFIWFKIGMARGFALLSVLIFLLVIGLYRQNFFNFPPSYMGLFQYFLSGMALGALIYKDRVPKFFIKNAWPLAAISFAILAISCSYFGHQTVEYYYYIFSNIVTIVLIFVFIGLYYKDQSKRYWVEHRVFVGLGDMSYSLYLTHAPILHLIWLFAGLVSLQKNTQFFILLTIATPICLFLGYVFYRAFEQPFLKSKYYKTVL